MREWFTLKELADTTLPGIPSTVQGLSKMASREGWEGRKRQGRGGGHEYHLTSLPTEARRALEARLAAHLLTRDFGTAKQLVPARAVQSNTLTERQRATADARVTIINAIEALRQSGITQKAAITTLLTEARTGQLRELNPVLDKALQMAKDPRGRGDGPYPSVRTLLRYLGASEKDLAPKKREAAPLPQWAAEFLSYWQRPEKPTIAHAYREWTKDWDTGARGCPPSEWAVRRFLEKMGNVSRHHNRMGARDIKNVKPFVRRAFEDLLPGDIYTADGHTFDREVAHPLHGRPFRPEITTWVDIATRRVVGISLALAESGLAVLDAFMNACMQGVPAIAYVDNGSGYVNAMMADKALGVMARVGTTMTHSIAYNSQARGVIERAHQTLWTEAAKSHAGYVGHAMDKQERQRQFKLSRQAIKGGAQPLQAWDDFVDWAHQRVDDYNNRPHSSLPKITDAAGRRRHMTPNETWQRHLDGGWEPATLSADDVAVVFRPRETRRVLRGEVSFMNNRYFSRDLEEFHGEDVAIAYDVMNAQYIWIFDLEHDRLICRAEWNANRKDYYPKAFVEQAREGRAKAKLNRLEKKREEALLELNGAPLLESDRSLVIGNQTVTADLLREQLKKPPTQHNATPINTFDAMSPSERFYLHRDYTTGAKPVPAEHIKWVEMYRRSKEYQAFMARLDESEFSGPAAATAGLYHQSAERRYR